MCMHVYCTWCYVCLYAFTCMCRDPAKKKDEVKAKPKQRVVQKKEDEGEWETVAKRATGQMTKQVRGDRGRHKTLLIL